MIIAFSLTAFAQKPKSTTAKLTKPEPKKVLDEKEEFSKALSEPSAAGRIAALQKFIENFPQSDEIIRAQELIVSARAQLGEEKLQAGDIENGLKFFNLAVSEVPKPMSEKLFADVVLQFPTNLFWRGQRAAALEIARMIEEKAEGNAKQLIGLATFYLGIENAAEAKRLAVKAIEVETASEFEKPNLPVAYQTLGLAHRLDFQLEESAQAYAKALELDPASAVSRRSLAEMKRATGKFDEAIGLYREMIARDETDLTARTGLTLSLFDAGRRKEAEAEMEKTLEANSNNLFLLVGAAYWYAANGDGGKAIELTREALIIEPRYTWTYIAMARGYLAQNRPLDAEKILLTARNYGSFPTLDYEIAAARMQAGFYREAADELKKSFAVKDGLIQTRLGRRVPKEARSFIELLSWERRASIFEPLAADNPENAQKLKSLLEFSQYLNSESAEETAVLAAADEFVKGEDKMKIHRQLFAAGRLLEKRKALPKVLEFTQAAVRGVDSALDVPNPSAAVMADELYETRSLANSRGEVLIVPEIPRQTLSVILRGRIEEITGWALYQQNKPGEAVTRLKRALSVLPEKSSWWRSTLWRLGAALEADGKPQEAIENYIKAYTNSEYKDAARYAVIESLYEKINGTTEGLEQKIGAKPPGLTETVAQVIEEPQIPPSSPEASTETKSAENAPEDLPTLTVEKPAAEEKTQPAETVTNSQKTEKETVSQTESVPATKVSPVPEIQPDPEKTEEKPAAESSSSPVPENSQKTEPRPTPEILEATKDQLVVKAAPTPEPEIKPETSPTPSPESIASAGLKETRSPVEMELLPSPTPEVQPVTEKAPPKLTEKLTVIVTENLPPPTAVKPAKKNSEPAPASNTIFEPVIINLPKSEIAEKSKPKKNFPENPETLYTKKPEESITEDKPEKPAANQENTAQNNSGSVRPRVIIEDKLPAAQSKKENRQCRIIVGQEEVSLVNSGGSLGILVEAEGGSTSEITAVSSSAKDVTVELEPEIGKLSGRAFFIVKSVSSNKGRYTISLESACGKKEIQVTVR